eukprot:TRINITY_DN2066_c0_g1_i1.p1 TRINITY_DN2066_c0_g1~~TRINITY_DN2066_c0_g1_i1.p1  ORF type:complete len:689 (-),score=219.18 TRINITY_DN2066_c0_g1_i1:456-2522(-)
MATDIYESAEFIVDEGTLSSVSVEDNLQQHQHVKSSTLDTKHSASSSSSSSSSEDENTTLKNSAHLHEDVEVVNTSQAAASPLSIDVNNLSLNNNDNNHNNDEGSSSSSQRNNAGNADKQPHTSTTTSDSDATSIPSPVMPTNNVFSSPTNEDTWSSSRPPPPARSPSSYQHHRLSTIYRNEEIYTQLAGLTNEQIKQHEGTNRSEQNGPVGFLAFIEQDLDAPLPPPPPGTVSTIGPVVKKDDVVASSGSGSESTKKKGWSLFKKKPKEPKPEKTNSNGSDKAKSPAAVRATPAATATTTAGTATTTTEEKLKATTDDEPPKVEKQTFVVSRIEELPEDCQKLVKQSGLPHDLLMSNFNILLNVLHFRTGKILKTPQNVNDPAHPSLPKSTRFSNGAELINPLPDLKKTYKEPKEAGHGGFGTVFHAKSALHKGKVVAVKKMPHKTKKQKISNHHEIAVLSACTHPNVVKYLTSHEVGEELWVVMEFLEGGTFEEAAKACRFSEANLAYVARELLKGISYLHLNEIAHRDLKSANIMMGIRGEVKLIDFGLCADMSVGNPKHMVGSPFWMPPEMIKCKPHDYSVDIWSFAISLLEMANQKPPMIESAVKAMFTVGTDGVTQFFVEPERWSVTFKDFLNRCLRLDPAERSTAEELLNHPFIRMADSRTNMESLLRRIFLRESLMNSGF